MSCFAFEVAIRKATDALHEASSATKMLRLEGPERAAVRATLFDLRQRLASLERAVTVYEVLAADPSSAGDQT